MASQIDQDATLLLAALAGAPRNEYVAAATLAGLTNLSPDRVDDAMSLLVDNGLAEWIQTMGNTFYLRTPSKIWRSTTGWRGELSRSFSKVAGSPEL